MLFLFELRDQNADSLKNLLKLYMQWKSIPFAAEEHIKTGLEATYPYGIGHCE